MNPFHYTITIAFKDSDPPLKWNLMSIKQKTLEQLLEGFKSIEGVCHTCLCGGIMTVTGDGIPTTVFQA